MRVIFYPRPGGGSRATLFRADRVVLELRSYDRKWRVPHDLAHAVAERELGISAGVFGCLAAGALFSSVRVVEGRLRHDARARGERIVSANARGIARAEIMAGALHHAVEHHHPVTGARAAWGSVEESEFPYRETDLARAAAELTRLAGAWSRLDAGAGLEFEWPERLTATVTAPRAGARAPRARPKGRRRLR
ncbi:MAG TPA: hypothetical protein VHC18_14185 [Amycolatopsis sp.]|nr:hypothetical protein [Amycolatopsis sp.]